MKSLLILKNLKCNLLSLTGGIGCGKTTVSNIFLKLGIPVIDTDLISRNILFKNKLVVNSIKNKFGIKNTNNKIMLKEIFFKSFHNKIWLEKLVHNIIIKKTIKKILEKKNCKYIVLVIPLLFELNLQEYLKHILLVDTKINNQISRVKIRDNLNYSIIKNILSFQANREYKSRKSNFVIYNNKNIKSLKEEVISLHKYFSSIIFKKF
ncbi:MAG: dephospho-CoA kinase [Enterobacteriaceae bacterium]